MSEIIKLGRHRLLCGDSCNVDDVQKLMEGKLADTVLTDPPYGMNKRIKNDNQSIEWYKLWIANSFRALKPYGGWLCFGNTASVFPFYYETLREKVLNSDITIRTLLKWDKGTGAGTLSPSNNTFVERGELVLYCVNGAIHRDKHYAKYFSKENEKILNDLRYLIGRAGGTKKVMRALGTTSVTHWMSKSEFAIPNAEQLSKLCELAGEPIEKYEGMRKARGTKKQLWYFDNTAAAVNDTLRYTYVSHGSRERMRGGNHPTMKPVSMLEDLIKMTTPPGGIVLDLFGGSGSTLAAAENTGRTCYMLEIDPKYIDVICGRYEYTQEKGLFA